MDDQQTAFVETFRRFMNELILTPRPQVDARTPLGDLVQDFLQTDVTILPMVTEDLATHRLVDADIALEELNAASAASVFGVTGGQQRGARPEFGRGSARLEILARDEAGSAALLGALRRLMLERSVLRGQVLAFSGNEFGPGAAGVDFLPRPHVPSDEIILPPGVLGDVARHVVGIGKHRDALRAAGQHLKRGVLLYGPPGSGKTLTVRHLLSETPGITAVVLAGDSIRFVTQAAELARAMQPAIVVLEDVDLIAADRSLSVGPQPLLFAMLDALDGLDGDADVAFVLTTNRVEVLEQALADRPGRIDLAVEIPLPDAAARHRLFTLYAGGISLSPQAITDAASRAEGVTGAFAKELMRRTVLLGAEQGRPPTDFDLATAMDTLLSTRDKLTRRLLGTEGSAAR